MTQVRVLDEFNLIIVQKGTTAEQLIEFAKEANIPMLKYYFKNVRPKQPDEDIESALDTCVRSSIALGNVEMLHLLIENGASVDGMDDGVSQKFHGNSNSPNRTLLLSCLPLN
jgi:hypothetical protein